MIKTENVIVLDVDKTLTISIEGGPIDYETVLVSERMKTMLWRLKNQGYWIILYTSRNMRTYDGNLGQIIKNTSPTLLKWLDQNHIPYDELHFGKPWCGEKGFYVDDRAIRPREFLELTIAELNELLERDRVNW